MKFTLNHRWLPKDETLAARLKQQLSRLAGAVRIEAAEVTLERQLVGSPPYVTRVHLVIPGPDLHAEGKDHTPEASIRKVLAALGRQIRNRRHKTDSKRRNGNECRPWKGTPSAAGLSAA